VGTESHDGAIHAKRGHGLTLSQHLHGEVFCKYSRAAAVSREPHLADTHAESALVLCREHDFAYYRAWAMIIQGWCLRRKGQPAVGVVQIQEGLAAVHANV
jgi:hypothetical protein